MINLYSQFKVFILFFEKLSAKVNFTFCDIISRPYVVVLWNRKFHINNIENIQSEQTHCTAQIYQRVCTDRNFFFSFSLIIISENPQKIIAQRHNKWTFEPYDPTVQQKKKIYWIKKRKRRNDVHMCVILEIYINI